MDSAFLKLSKYVNASADLAESLEADIKTGSRKISDKTVLCLSKLITAASAAAQLLDDVETAAGDRKLQ